jgi:hypothetical protein
MDRLCSSRRRRRRRRLKNKLKTKQKPFSCPIGSVIEAEQGSIAGFFYVQPPLASI